MPLPIVILISGRGSNMVAIAKAIEAGTTSARIAAVISNQADAAGLERARELGLATAVLSHRDFPDRATFDRALATTVQAYSPALVVLAGFMRVLSHEFVQTFSGRLLNIHPSLLPNYRGLHTHQRVLNAREDAHGCSVHFVTEELDGGPVIVQARVPVKPDDTADTLSARVHVQEHKIYPLAVEWFAAGRLQLKADRVWLDGKPLDRPVVLDS